MMECMKSMAKKPKDERIKVSDLEIIVTMMNKDPYYEIKYKEIGEDYYHVGYSSYKLENVLAWKDECFEIVKECRPQTNADRIRSMTDEELAEFLPIASNFICQPTEECIRNTVTNHCGECERTEECAMKWLKAESEE
jgi:hypothetical protein